MANMAVMSHFSVSPNLLMALALTTPFSVPIRVPELPRTGPSHIPECHSVCALFALANPGLISRYHTSSPMGTTTDLHLLPFSLSNDVRPSFPTAYLEWHMAAHLMIQGIKSQSKGNLSSTPSSTCVMKVHANSRTVFPASSM